MDWSVGDFALAAVLLGVAGVLFVTAVRKPRSPGYRAAAVVLGAVALTVRLARRRV